MPFDGESLTQPASQPMASSFTGHYSASLSQGSIRSNASHKHFVPAGASHRKAIRLFLKPTSGRAEAISVFSSRKRTVSNAPGSGSKDACFSKSLKNQRWEHARLEIINRAFIYAPRNCFVSNTGFREIGLRNLRSFRGRDQTNWKSHGLKRTVHVCLGTSFGSTYVGITTEHTNIHRCVRF